MYQVKGKAKLTIYIEESIAIKLRHLSVESRSTLSVFIENLLKESLQKAKLI